MIRILHKETGEVLATIANDILVSADLRGLCLAGANLSRKSLPFSNLQGADLRDADLTSALLDHANLRGADLRGACLKGASLLGTDLEGANWEGADLADIRSDGDTRWPSPHDVPASASDGSADAPSRVNPTPPTPGAFPEYRVHLDPVPDGERAVNLKDLGQRTKLGGYPDWIQGDWTPVCPHCQKRMGFVAQIDSIDYDGYGREGPYMFGDVGMIYVFYCHFCSEPQAIHQDY